MSGLPSPPPEPVKYDDAGYHSGAAADAGYPMEHGFTHIGVYLAWLIRHDLHNPEVFPPDHIAMVKSGEMSGSDIADDVDHKLVSFEMSDEGAAFSDTYYDRYVDEYDRLFQKEQDYGIEDDSNTYARIAPLIDRAYATWIAAGRPKPLPKNPEPLPRLPTDFPTADAPEDMTQEELDAYLDAVVKSVDPDAVRIDNLPMPHASPGLEQIFIDRLGLRPDQVSSLPASQYGSSLLTWALKRLGVAPRDAMVVSSVFGTGANTIMATIYAVPGVDKEHLEARLATVMRGTSSRQSKSIEIAGQLVKSISDSEFAAILWAVDGLLFDLGATATADIEDVARRLLAESP